MIVLNMFMNDRSMNTLAGVREMCVNTMSVTLKKMATATEVNCSPYNTDKTALF